MGCPEVFGNCPEVFGCIKTVHLGQLKHIGLIQAGQSFFFRYNLTFLYLAYDPRSWKGSFFDKNQEKHIDILRFLTVYCTF